MSVSQVVSFNLLRPANQDLWLVGVVLLAGCGGSSSAVAPAKGVVLLDGKPLARAYVTFIPEKGRSATGQTGADGTFSLTTYRPDDGAVVGKHLVTVVAREPEVENPSPGAVGIKRPGRSLIPEVYGNTATSGLTFDVVEGEQNNFNMQLSSQSDRHTDR